MRRSKFRRLAFEHCESRRMLAVGALDTSFGNDGFAEIANEQAENSDDSGTAFVRDASGRLLVAGTRQTTTGISAVVVRYTPNGQLDTTFGQAGVATVNWGGKQDFIRAMALAPDGGIIVTGSMRVESYFYLAASRITPEGFVDESFGNQGFAETGLSRNSDGRGVVIDSDGTIYIAAASEFTRADRPVVVVALTADGVLDASYGTNGQARHTNVGDSLFPSDLSLLPDGGIAVLATYGISPAQAVLVKFDANGNVDANYGVEGTNTISVGTDHAFSSFARLDLEKDAAGNLYVAGRRETIDGVLPFNFDFVVAKVSADGLVDTTFGSQGLATIDAPSWRVQDFSNIDVLADGSIYLSGVVVETNQSSDLNFLIARMTESGDLDTTFALNGLFISDLGLEWTQYHSTLTDIDGVVETTEGDVVVAFTAVPPGADADFGLLGLKADGRVDTSFANSGLSVLNLSETTTSTAGLAATELGTGQILQVVRDTVTNRLTLIRYERDGTIDASYGVDGQVDLPVMSGQRYPYTDLVNNDSARFVIVESDDALWFGKLTSDGRVDTGFGQNGWATFSHQDYYSAFSVGYEYIHSVRVTSTGQFYVLGDWYDRESGQDAYRIVRLSADLTVDASFDNQGPILFNKHASNLSGDQGQICVDGARGVFALLSNTVGHQFGVSLHHILNDGTVDDAFGTDGEVATAMDVGFGNITSLYIKCSPDRLLVGGETRIDSLLSYTRVIIAQYTLTGEPDVSFGNQGATRLSSGAKSVSLRDLQIDQAGRIIVGTHALNGRMLDAAITRLTPSGAADLSFGIAGASQFDNLGFNDEVTSLVTIAGGSVFVSGTSSSTRESRAILARLEGDPAWHNFDNRYDVNGDRHVTSNDVLQIVNDINRHGSRSLGIPVALAPPFIDINHDGLASPNDALVLINFINRGLGAIGVGEGESTLGQSALGPGVLVFAAKPHAAALRPLEPSRDPAVREYPAQRDPPVPITRRAVQARVNFASIRDHDEGGDRDITEKLDEDNVDTLLRQEGAT